MMPAIQLPRRGRARVEFERFVDGCAGELLRTAYLIVWDLAEAEEFGAELGFEEVAGGGGEAGVGVVDSGALLRSAARSFEGQRRGFFFEGGG